MPDAVGADESIPETAFRMINFCVLTIHIIYCIVYTGGDTHETLEYYIAG